MSEIIQGQVVAYFAFDVGYEIDLSVAGQLLGTMPIPPLSRKKQMPPYLQYANTPQIVSWGEAASLVAGAGTVQMTVFDFGVVSLAYRWPLATPAQSLALAELPTLSQRLALLDLETQARVQVEAFLAKIAPAVQRLELSPLVEDYYVFILEKMAEPLTARDLVARERATFAQVLRFDTQTLSAEQQEEALSQSISYYEHDVVLVDWNAAIIYDTDYADALTVMELLNVELLEARYIDARLDIRISAFEGLRFRRSEWPLPFRTPYRKAIEDLAELRLDALILGDRVDNALKLIGDLYLARIHNAATKRFNLPEWEAAIAQKLDIAANLYQLLTDRVNAAQGQTLEIIVIVLIAIEIVMGLIRLH